MTLKFRSRTTIFLHDLGMIPLAWFGAYWLRFNLQEIPDEFFYSAFLFLPWVMAIQVSLFWVFGLYRGVWRFSSLPDLIRIGKAVLTGIFFIASALFLYDRLQGVPRSVVPLYVLILFSLLSIPRLVYRFWKEQTFAERVGRRALIVGAGSAGDMLVRDLLANVDSDYVPVIFVDDNHGKYKREIRGIRVAGTVEQIPELIERWNIETVLIAVPSASDQQMRRIVEICENCSVDFQTLPSVKELLSSAVTTANLRSVSIEDILGRTPVKLDWPGIKNHLRDKVILVTGGGGSIGSELCKQLARAQPRKLIVFDQCEFNLYKINADLSRLFPELSHQAVLGDVADPVAVQQLIAGQQPEIVFHAAAYKHVPLLENQIREAVHNNLIGTKILAEAAIAAGVARFVLISTDKAVNPTNVMGATKRAAEILCQNLNQSGNTRFTTVRFGNVLDSAGSVVPLFREQIKAGGPITVTHPDITRYFMTIPEACQLIMQAETIGQGGEVFVLDMGEPVKITYLAEQMIRLSGKVPNKDIEIKIVGLRPGEKLYEELFHDQEQLLATSHAKLRLAKARLYDSVEWAKQIEDLQRVCRNYDNQQLLAGLKQLVPEFNTPS
ncbi:MULTISPECIES: polysaccharide biosynthesis protein [Methylomonas]|uniref:Multidrug MFS transporter n=2 Tax=Methylomonas TaxID=416 RepID=A0A126T308_9GAMM|nr:MULTISPECIES: nucleoside-diphosphate sugar epimerase/dehydratase [Methylomonas]AMK76473.1 multidrug MFS transporter [Methylomonas denitrificans]OAH98731.1 multidrug MFS transporter [Methylomonas methanica]TCV88507.1 FlaA1/EpsC-like NDP-sugar epimerase [Methylomonas methanica]